MQFRRSTMPARLIVLTATAVLLGGAPALPAVADEPPAQPAAQPAQPAPAARAVPPGTELVERRNAVSRTFATDDPETFKTEIHTRPIHFKDEHGRWQVVDPTLVPGPNGHVHSKANDMLVDIAPTTSGRLATVRFDNATSIGFGLTGAAPMPPKVARDTATFPGLLPSVDVQLTSLPGGLKETLVLHGRTAPTTYVFPLHLENLTAKLVDGAVVLKDARGTDRGRIPRGWMVDSAIHPGSGDGVRSDDVTYRIVGTGPTGTALLVTLDKEWLADPARKFPVYVDPTVYNAGGDDTYVMSPFYNDYSTDVELKSGTYDDGWHRARSFIHFFGANELDGKIIGDADIRVYEHHAWSCNPSKVELKRITESWNGHGYYEFPGFALGAIVGEATVARGHPNCPTGPGYVDFDVDWAMKNWANDSWPNYGVAIVAAEEYVSNGWKKWSSAQTSNDPRLVVTWSEPNHEPSIVTNRSVSPKACSWCSPVVTNDSRPVITGSANDSDGDVMRIDFEVYQGHLSTTDSMGHAMPSGAPLLTSGSIGQKTSGSIANWSVWPALNDGSYSYRARAWDGKAYGVWSNGWTHFVVDAIAPDPPSVWSATHPFSSTWYSNANPSLQFNATSESGIAGYSYQIDRNYYSEPDYSSEGTGGAASYSGLSDGTWYFHVRALSNAGAWSQKKTFTVLIDTTAPTQPSSAWSTSHNQYAYSTDQTIDVGWWASTDGASGLAGYAYAFNNSSATPAGTAVNVGPSVKAITSQALADGTWWFHVRAVDYAGNVSTDLAFGPFYVNANKPGPPVISSSTHSSTAWSSSRTAEFTWTPPKDAFGIAGYSVVFDNSPGGSPPSVINTSSPKWTQYGVPDGFSYIHVAAVNNAGVWGTTSTYGIKVDATKPQAPILGSPSHESSVTWYSNDTVHINASASAASGILGYNYTILREPTSNTGTFVNSSSSSTVFMGLADGRWYVHARAISNSGLASDVTNFEVLIDRTVPSAPKITSTTHNTTDATNQRSVTIDWAALPSSDASSGVVGYSVAFNNATTTQADATVETKGTRFVSPVLGDGVWYAHVRAVDRAGNLGPDVWFGPIKIDQFAPPVGATETNRFVALWKPRVTSDTWGAEYLAKPGYPPEILAEGFHGMSAEQKAYLAAALFTALVTDDPLPTSYDATTVGHVRTLIRDFVFDKDALAAVQKQFGPAVDTMDRSFTEVVKPLPEMLQAALDDAQPLFDGVDLDLAELPAESYDEVADDFEDLEPATEVDVTSELDPENTALLDSVDNGLVDPVDDVEAELSEIVADADVDVDPSPIFTAVPPLPVSIDYQLCWRSASDSGCQQGFVAVPSFVDVTGDDTNDLAVTFSPSANANAVNPAALTFGLLARRYVPPVTGNDTSGKAIRAHVWIDYDIGLTRKRFSAGFDGYHRGTALSEETNATIGFPDPAKVSAGNLVFNYGISHTDPAATWALTAGLRDLADGANPREASIQFAPPTNANGTVDLTHQDEGTTTTETTDVTYEANVPTKLNALYNTKDGSDRSSHARLILDQLPQKAHARVERTEGADGATRLRLAGETSARMGRAVYTSVTKKGDETTRVLTDVRNTPRSMEFEMSRDSGRFTAAYDATRTEKLDKVAISYSRRVAGTLQRAVTGRARDVPSWLQASFGRSDQTGDDSLLVSYAGIDVLPFAAFSGIDKPAGVTMLASATRIPLNVTGSASASGKSADLRASAPIGSLRVSGSRNGGKVLKLGPDVEHATLVADGDKLGVHAYVTGLVGVSADFGTSVGSIADDAISGTAEFLPGGQRFRVIGRTGTMAGRVDVSNVPTFTSFGVSPATHSASFQTREHVDRVSFFAIKRPGGPVVEGRLEGLPRDVSVSALVGEGVESIHYDSSGRLGDARVMFSTDLRPGDGTGITLCGHAHDVPTRVHTRFVREDRYVHFTANDPVGLLEGTLSKGGAKAQKFAGDHVSFNGTALKYAASAQVHGLRSLEALLAGGGQETWASMSVAPDDRSFVVNGALDDDRVYARVSDMPRDVKVSFDGLRTVTYTASDRVPRIVGYKSRAGGPTFQASVDDMPTRVTAAAVIEDPVYRFTYDGDTGADRMRVYYSPKHVRFRGEARSQFASGSVDQPPAWAAFEADTTVGKVKYRASNRAGGARIAVNGLFAPKLVLEANVQGIPAAFDVKRTADETKFEPSDPVGSVKFRASNKGQPANRQGNHLFVRTSKEADTFDVSLEATDVGAFRYTKEGESVTVAGNVGLRGNPFTVDARLDGPAPDSGSGADEYRIAAKGTIANLPSRFTITRSPGKVVYDASSSMKVNNLDVSLGWIKALDDTPRPPARNGISVTDGLCRGGTGGCDPTTLTGAVKGFCDAEREVCKAVKLRIDYDALGNGLDVHLGSQGPIVDMAPISPPTRRLEVRADLDDVVKDPLFVDLRQDGIEPGTGLHFGPIYVDRIDGALGVVVETAHSRALGALSADVRLKGRSIDDGDLRYGDWRGTARISNVPAKMALQVRVGGETTGRLALSEGIGRISVQASVTVSRKQFGGGYAPTGDPAHASVVFRDVPEATEADPITFRLAAARQPSNGNRDVTTLPGFVYKAPAGTLDLGVHVSPRLQAFHPHDLVSFVVEKVAAHFVDLGTDVSMVYADNAPKRLIVTSLGRRTGEIYVEVGLDVHVSKDFPEKTSTEFGVRFRRSAYVGLHVTAPHVSVRLRDVGWTQVTPGEAYFAYAIEGDYGTFEIDTPGIRFDLDAWAEVMVQLWPFKSWSTLYDGRFSYDATSTSIFGHVGKKDVSADTGLCVGIRVGLVSGSGRIHTRPSPTQAGARQRNGVTVRGSGGQQVFSYADPYEGGESYEWVPAMVDMITAGFSDPYGNGSISFPSSDWRFPSEC